MNISHYLYPNDYNPSIGTFSFNRYILVKMHFWYISNKKGYVIFIDTFSYIYMCVCVCVCVCNLNWIFIQKNFSTWIFHFIHFTNEYSPTVYHYYNLSFCVYIYIYIHTQHPFATSPWSQLLANISNGVSCKSQRITKCKRSNHNIGHCHSEFGKYCLPKRLSRFLLLRDKEQAQDRSKRKAQVHM